jgi:5-methylcytosine-specific restriction protein A
VSRKQFIELQGATCRNWTWSWSFVNDAQHFVIFGVWDVYDEGGRALLFSESWRIGRKGRREAAWPQSREHIRLVEEEGYQLKTFAMQKAPDDPRDPEAPWRIADFTRSVEERQLQRIGDDWFAVSGDVFSYLPEEIASDEALLEGASTAVLVNQYERNALARKLCLQHHGVTCAVCGVDFGKRYGQLGEGYIHVHHLVPLSETLGEYEVDPVRDLLPICPNCHAMIHSTRPARTPDQVRSALSGEADDGIAR